MLQKIWFQGPLSPYLEGEIFMIRIKIADDTYGNVEIMDDKSSISDLVAAIAKAEISCNESETRSKEIKIQKMLELLKDI